MWRLDGALSSVELSTEGFPAAAAFSPDARQLITLGSDLAQVWSLDAPKPPVTFRAPQSAIAFAAFSPDGRHVLTADSHRVRMWPIEPPELRSLLQKANVDCLAPALRRAYLEEAPEQSLQRYMECERSYGRPPFSTAAR